MPERRRPVVWRCESCKRPLGDIDAQGRLRWYDEAVSVAAGRGNVRLVVCRYCDRVNPFRGPPLQILDSGERL